MSESLSVREERLADLERLERDVRAAVRETYRLSRPTAPGAPDDLHDARRLLEAAHSQLRSAVARAARRGVPS